MIVKRGDTFNRLMVTEANVEPPIDKSYARDIGRWHKCLCSCRKHSIVLVPESSLLKGNTQSCGCLRREKAKEQINVNREQMIKNGNNTTPTSKVHNLEFNGESKSITKWADDIGITKQALSKRLKKMPVEKALTMKGRNKNGN